MLKQVKPFVEDGLHPQTIARGVRKAVGLISKTVRGRRGHAPGPTPKKIEILAGTALNSKLIANYKDLFAPMVVDAVIALDPLLLDLKLVGVKKVPGGSVTDSFFVRAWRSRRRCPRAAPASVFFPERPPRSLRRRRARASAPPPSSDTHRHVTNAGTPASSR